MLDDREIPYRYREYTKEPFTEAELRGILKMLDVGPTAVLRKRDKAYKELGLDGSEADDLLVRHMVAHPTLVQRPIGVASGRAVIGRPVEALLTLADG